MGRNSPSLNNDTLYARAEAAHGPKQPTGRSRPPPHPTLWYTQSPPTPASQHARHTLFGWATHVFRRGRLSAGVFCHARHGSSCHRLCLCLSAGRLPSGRQPPPFSQRPPPFSQPSLRRALRENQGPRPKQPLAPRPKQPLAPRRKRPVAPRPKRPLAPRPKRPVAPRPRQPLVPPW